MNILQKSTLRKYLLDKRIELYETVNELKDKMLGNNFTERDEINLEVAEAPLEILSQSVITETSIKLNYIKIKLN